TTFNVGAGSALGSVVLASTGTIRNGTINDDGTGLSLSAVTAIPTLDGVTYQGTLNVVDGNVIINNGITFAGLNGTGQATINFAASLTIQSSTVLDNARLNTSTRSNFAGDQITALFQAGVTPTLTLGANLVIDHSTATSSDLNINGANVVNLGTINA